MHACVRAIECAGTSGDLRQFYNVGGRNWESSDLTSLSESLPPGSSTLRSKLGLQPRPCMARRRGLGWLAILRTLLELKAHEHQELLGCLPTRYVYRAVWAAQSPKG